MQEKVTQQTATEEMASRELAVQFGSNLWRQFLTDHDGLLLICERRQIGMHSCRPENSLDAKDKAARSTPLCREGTLHCRHMISQRHHLKGAGRPCRMLRVRPRAHISWQRSCSSLRPCTILIAPRKIHKHEWFGR